MPVITRVTTIDVLAVTSQGMRMDREKLEQFSKITACIGSCMDGLLQAQELMVELMCKECDIPVEMKETMINDMNKVMGIKKL